VADQNGRTITVTATVRIPRPPNFLRMTDGQVIPVEALMEDGLRELGAKWTDQLVEHARKRREEGAGGI